MACIPEKQLSRHMREILGPFGKKVHSHCLGVKVGRNSPSARTSLGWESPLFLSDYGLDQQNYATSFQWPMELSLDLWFF